MKFELEPDNRNCPDSVLLDDLRRVAAELGRKTVTESEYDAAGRFSEATIIRRLGSWNEALVKSGLEVGRQINIPREELVEDLKRVASELGKESLTAVEYRVHAKFSVDAVQRAFGSWKRGLLDAGLKLPPNYHRHASEEELLANIGRVWEEVRRQPRTSDLDGPYSLYGRAIYRRRFGSLRKALEAFVASVNEAEAEDIATTTAPATTTMGDPRFYRHKTPRNISWRLKFLVMRRDHYRCCITGRSPATDPTVILVVDHIIPWEKGGETVMENLQTLCQEMNIAKSNLDMYIDGPGAEQQGRGTTTDGGLRNDAQRQDAEEQGREDGSRTEATGSRKDAESQSSLGNEDQTRDSEEQGRGVADAETRGHGDAEIPQRGRDAEIRSAEGERKDGERQNAKDGRPKDGLQPETTDPRAEDTGNVEHPPQSCDPTPPQ